MTTDYIALPADMTVREALDKIRLEGPAKESIYTIFVLDEGRHLVGSVGLADLILAHPSKKLRDIMDDQVIAVQAEADQEEATYKFSRYDLVALPVVDAQGNLVGIITHDDALDVIEQERTEDMERFMAISGKHEDTSYLQTSIWTHFSHRVVWLVILAVLGLVSGAILQSFQETLMNLMILAFYMPMLADTGGNTGSQSATVVVRALVASPALTTIVDISGLFIYFSTARLILGI
jgi:magnesium transporter